jgi:hypothetical protein
VKPLPTLYQGLGNARVEFYLMSIEDLAAQQRRETTERAKRHAKRQDDAVFLSTGGTALIGGDTVSVSSGSNGPFVPGQAAAFLGSGVVDVPSRGRETFAFSPVTEKNYLKIFAYTQSGNLRKYWLVGVFSQPKLIIEIDLAQEIPVQAKGESTGTKAKDWVFGIKTSKKGTLPQPFKLQTIYGSGSSYDSGWAQIYESQSYKGNGLWAGSLTLDNLTFLPDTIQIVAESFRTETVSLPLNWFTDTYFNATPRIRYAPTGLFLTEQEYKDIRNLDFQVQILQRYREVTDFVWWGTQPSGQSNYDRRFLRVPPDTGNAGAFESKFDETKQYTILGGSYFDGVFSVQNGSMVENTIYRGRSVFNYTYYPEPEYNHFRQETKRRFTVYLGPNTPVACTVDHVNTSDRDGLVPVTIVEAGTEYHPILQKSFKDGGYYMQLASGAFTRLTSGNSAPVDFRIKPSVNAPEIVLNNHVNLDADMSWVATDDKVNLYFCQENLGQRDWLTTGTARIEEFSLSGGQYNPTATSITSSFRPVSAEGLGVGDLADVTIMGAYYWKP